MDEWAMPVRRQRRSETMGPCERHELRRVLAEAIMQVPVRLPEPGEPICRECGCRDWNACVDVREGPCWWVEEGLCSVCAARMPAEADPARSGLYVEDGR